VSGSGRLFGSLELAARIERADCRLLEDAVRAGRERDPAGDWLAIPLAGGVATWAGEGSPLDKVAGLGFAAPPTTRELGEVEEAIHSRGAPVRIELATLAGAGIAVELTARGYRLLGFENVLGRDLGEWAAASEDGCVEIERARDGEDGFGEWLDVVVAGFGAPDAQGVPSGEEFPREALERAIRDLTAGSGITRYLARIDGVAVGGASLRLDGGIAQLTGAATLPSFRRRGVQSALLASRLADAAAAGCEVAVVTTEPGSKSQQNVQRQGFDLLYSRAVLVLDP